MALLRGRIALIHAVVAVVCSLGVGATAAAGTIERVTKQQILASIPPMGMGHGKEPVGVTFLASPSGKYVANLVRTQTMPGAGGLGADFCFVEVMDTAAGGSVWESECRPVSTVNTCALLFSWHGLEVFDGGEEVWHGETNTDGTNFLQTLELVDQGDMRIRDKDGQLAWRASDESRQSQRCGALGSPGLAAALPPFAEPITDQLPFGNGHAAEAQASFVATHAGGRQPLVHNSPDDSAAWKLHGRYAAIGAALFVSVVVAGF